MPELNRRDFLTAAAATTAALTLPAMASESKPAAAPNAVPAPAPAAKAPSKRTLRKAVMIGMVNEGDTVLDKFNIMRDCGFDGVEMDSPTKTTTDEILAAQEKTGLLVHGVVNSVHWAKPLNHPNENVRKDAVTALETCLRDGKKYGSTSVLLVPGVVNNDFAYDDCYRISQREIGKVLALAKECDVKIGIENVWNNFLLSPLEAAKYVDEFDNPATGQMVGWHLDIGNIINFGRPAQWARILGKRIVKLHIKDFSLKKRDGQGLWKGFDVELGDGDAGWADVMKALDDTGYTTAQGPAANWATAEVGGGDRKRLKQVAEQMDKLFAM